jgi:rhodanese-related sulfurtransferase
MKISKFAIISYLSVNLFLAGNGLAIEPNSNSTAQKPAAQTGIDEQIITAEALLARMNKDEALLVIDVRTEGQYKSSGQRIKGDIRIDTEEEIDAKMKNVPPDRLIVTYCSCPDEATSLYFVNILKKKGFKNARALKGGYYAWLRVDGPTEGR